MNKPINSKEDGDRSGGRRSLFVEVLEVFVFALLLFWGGMVNTVQAADVGTDTGSSMTAVVNDPGSRAASADSMAVVAQSREQSPPWLSDNERQAAGVPLPQEFGVSDEDLAMAEINLDLRRTDAPRYSRLINFGDYAYLHPKDLYSNATNDMADLNIYSNRAVMMVENLSSRTAKVRFQLVSSSDAKVRVEYDLALPPGSGANVLRFPLDWSTWPRGDRFIVHSDEPVYFSGHLYVEQYHEQFDLGQDNYMHSNRSAYDRQLVVHAVDCGSEYAGNEWLCQVSVAQPPWSVQLTPP
ncbi:MAG: hypothetical protein ABW095_01795 [Candidatus Thiodiazotropha sp.]